MIEKICLISTVVILLAGCQLCDEKAIEEVKSPDARYIATKFERNCGSPGGFVLHVNIRDSSQEFIADSSGKIVQGEVLSYESGMVGLEWLDNTHFLIKHEDGRVYTAEKSWNGIEVTYQKVAKTDSNSDSNQPRQ